MNMMRLENLNSMLAIFALLFLSPKAEAQDAYREQIILYIEAYAPLAIKEMSRTGFPASIKIAQGIHESGAGKSNLVSRSNNHFGIKCKSSWEGEKVYHDDDEAGECFRKYKSAEDSYLDHSNYLKSQSRYAFLFEYDADDHTSWAWGLKKAGYATSPVYAETIIKYVETYQLNELNPYAEADEEEIDLSAYFSRVRSNLPATTVSAPVLVSKPEPNNAFKAAEKSIGSNNTKKSNALYPIGIFKINGVKVVYAEEGTSLLSLARKHKVQLSSILLFNDLPKTAMLLKKDQLVYLQRKKKTGKKTFHRVKPGETVVDNSQVEGTRLATSSEHKKTKNKKKAAVHVVKKGESLSAIAKKYRVTVDSIKDANKMKNNNLSIGQSLKILK